MPPAQHPDDLITEPAFCEWVGISTECARKWRRIPGKGPAFKKLGALVRYRRGDVQAWLDANTFESNYRPAAIAA